MTKTTIKIRAKVRLIDAADTDSGHGGFSGAGEVTSIRRYDGKVGVTWPTLDYNGRPEGERFYYPADLCLA
jgi:hypothetical protein